MRTFTLAVVLGFVSGVLLLHGCGLDVTGFADQAEAGIVTPLGDAQGAAESGTSGSGGEGGSRDDAMAEAGPTCTCAAPPTGWELVAYADDRKTPCATGLRTDERVTAPNAPADSCSCDCQIKTTPSCSKGTFTSKRDENGSGAAQCNDDGTPHDADDGNCQKESNNLVDHRRAVPPPPFGAGTCDAPGVAHIEKVTSKTVRVCAADGPGDCVCSPEGPFRTCVRKGGDQTCPAAFPKKLALGTAAGVTCAPCGCKVGATCSGAINYYSDDRCNTLAEAIDDQSCQRETATSFQSFKWVGKVNATCNVQAPAAGPVPTLADTETICCP